MSTIHASCVLIGAKAVLIRGPSGAGKSRLAWDLIRAAATGALPFARLVADDRAFVEARAGRLLVRPAPELAGLIEIRGLGIRRVPYEAVAAIGLIVDLAATDAARLPAPDSGATVISGIRLPRLAVAAEAATIGRVSGPALGQVLAWQGTTPAHD
jgi:serine kinase of HPr protein (carbohydrate metabolism regulator)